MTFEHPVSIWNEVEFTPGLFKVKLLRVLGLDPSYPPILRLLYVFAS